jgi:hypothetical protein
MIVEQAGHYEQDGKVFKFYPRMRTESVLLLTGSIPALLVCFPIFKAAAGFQIKWAILLV